MILQYILIFLPVLTHYEVGGMHITCHHKTATYVLFNDTVTLSSFLKHTALLTSNQFCHEYDSLNIICLGKLKLDGDLITDRNELHLTIIAAEWEIIRNVTIHLEGRNADSKFYSAPSPMTIAGAKGMDGKDANAGENGGSFFGVYGKITNPWRLTVDISGGNGGNGQDGGDGGSASTFVMSEGYRDGGNGGDGGCAGEGGLAGVVELYGIESNKLVNTTSVINTIVRDGKTGAHGRGGRGGYGVVIGSKKQCRNGHCRVMNVYSQHGHPGKGGNEIGIIRRAKRKIINGLTEAITTFRNFTKSSKKHQAATALLHSIDDTGYKTIQYMTPASFIDELILTLQFSSEINRDDLENLQTRFEYFITYKGNELTDSDLHISLVGYSALMMQKLARFEENPILMITDITSYFETVSERAQELKHKKVSMFAEEMSQQADAYIHEMVHEVNKFCNVISRRLRGLGKDIDKKFWELIKIFQTEASHQREILKAQNNTKKIYGIEYTTIAKRALQSVNVIAGMIAGVSGPLGLVATIVETSTTMFVGNIDKNTAVQRTVQPTFLLPVKPVEREILDDFATSASMEVGTINEFLASSNATDTEWYEKISEAKSELSIVIDAATRNNNSSNRPAETIKHQKNIANSRRKVFNVVKSFLENLDGSVNHYVQSLLVTLQFSGNPFTNYGFYLANPEKDPDIQLAERNLETIENNTLELYNVFIPALQELTDAVQETSFDANKLSKAVVTFRGWKVKQSIDAIRETLRPYFKYVPAIGHYLDKFRETTECMFSLFTTISNYHEINTLRKASQYIGDHFEISNSNMRLRLETLEYFNRLNLFEIEYTRAMNALKLWAFPFAKYYEPAMNNLKDLTNNTDTEVIYRQFITGIQQVHNTLKRYKATISKQDEKLTQACFTSKLNSSQPFYVWKGPGVESQIHNLFSNKTIRMQATLTVCSATAQEHHKRSAIKFKSIQLAIIPKPDVPHDIAEKIKQTLSFFTVYLTHKGESYYRVGNNVYVIRSKPLKFHHSFEHENVNQDICSRSAIASASAIKSHDGDYFYSPYTTWQFKLKQTGIAHNLFDELKMYSNHVYLELTGYGVYLDEMEMGQRAIEDLNLEKYYEVASGPCLETTGEMFA